MGVTVMDRFFQEQRDKKADEKTARKIEKKNYAKLKEEYKMQAEMDVREGRMAPLEEIFSSKATDDAPPSEGVIPSGAAAIGTGPKTLPSGEKSSLSAGDMAEIDSLFAGVPTKPKSPAKMPAGDAKKKEALDKAKALIFGA